MSRQAIEQSSGTAEFVVFHRKKIPLEPWMIDALNNADDPYDETVYPIITESYHRVADGTTESDDAQLVCDRAYRHVEALGHPMEFGDIVRVATPEGFRFFRFDGPHGWAWVVPNIYSSRSLFD